MVNLFISPSTANPDHWGRATWDYLFIMASHFPHGKTESDDVELTEKGVNSIRQTWKQQIAILLQMLPCGGCKNHFDAFIKKHPLRDALQDRDTLFAWLHKAKEQVRKQQGKLSIPLAKVKTTYIPVAETGALRVRNRAKYKSHGVPKRRLFATRA